MPWGFNQAKESIPESYCPQCGSLLVAGRKKGSLACTLCGLQFPQPAGKMAEKEVSPIVAKAEVASTPQTQPQAVAQARTACQHALDWLTENHGDAVVIAELLAALDALDKAGF